MEISEETNSKLENALQTLSTKRGFTPTELKIFRLRIQGLCLHEIAEESCISKRTIQSHVNHYLAKLNFIPFSKSDKYSAERYFLFQLVDIDSLIQYAVEANFSAREKEVFLLKCEGNSQLQIAEKLIITRGTVNTHIKNYNNKFGVEFMDQHRELKFMYSTLTQEENV
jgi:DNA-binding NarL/FixJ family response regulator